MEFSTQYQQLVRNLLERDINRSDGILESTIIKFEIEKNLNLPHALREYYRLLGNLDCINQAHNRLLKLDNIDIEANKLIFMAENQGVYFWGIDLGDFKQKNPPIYRWDSMYNSVGLSNTEEWTIDDSKCFDFLIAMFYWQSALGGLSYGGIGNIDEAQFKKIETGWYFIKEYQGTKIYGGLGTSICICEYPDSIELKVGGNHENAFEKIKQKLEIDWNYIY